MKIKENLPTFCLHRVNRRLRFGWFGGFFPTSHSRFESRWFSFSSTDATIGVDFREKIVTIEGCDVRLVFMLTLFWLDSLVYRLCDTGRADYSKANWVLFITIWCFNRELYAVGISYHGYHWTFCVTIEGLLSLRVVVGGKQKLSRATDITRKQTHSGKNNGRQKPAPDSMKKFSASVYSKLEFKRS